MRAHERWLASLPSQRHSHDMPDVCVDRRNSGALDQLGLEIDN